MKREIEEAAMKVGYGKQAKAGAPSFMVHYTEQMAAKKAAQVFVGPPPTHPPLTACTVPGLWRFIHCTWLRSGGGRGTAAAGGGGDEGGEQER